MNEFRKEVTIVNKRGLHARASAKFVGAVAALPEATQVQVAKDGTQAAGGGAVGLISTLVQSVLNSATPEARRFPPRK